MTCDATPVLHGATPGKMGVSVGTGKLQSNLFEAHLLLAAVFLTVLPSMACKSSSSLVSKWNRSGFGKDKERRLFLAGYDDGSQGRIQGLT